MGKTKNINLENLKDFKDNIDKTIPKEKELTQAEYDNLSEAEKNNGTTYFIKDGIPTGSNGSAVEKSDTNGNILVNDEEVQVYDDTELQGQVDNLSSKFKDVGTEVNPIYIEDGEFKKVAHELATDVPPGGTTRQFLRGDGKWASPEYNPEIIVTNISFDKFLREDTSSSSMSKIVELDANKNYQLFYNGFYASAHYVTGYECKVYITLEDFHPDKINTNIKTILNTSSTSQQVLDFSTEDYANPILNIAYSYKIVPALADNSSYTKNNVIVKGAGTKFDWGTPLALQLGTMIQFDTTALGDKWTYFNIGVHNGSYQNQEFITHNRTDAAADRGNFHIEYNKTTKILSVYPFKMGESEKRFDKRYYVFYFDDAYNTCIAANFFATYSDSHLKTYPLSMSLKRDYISIPEQRIDELESRVAEVESKTSTEITTTISASSTNNQVTGAKVVYDFVKSSMPIGSLSLLKSVVVPYHGTEIETQTLSAKELFGGEVNSSANNGYILATLQTGNPEWALYLICYKVGRMTIKNILTTDMTGTISEGGYQTLLLSGCNHSDVTFSFFKINGLPICR